MQAWTDGCNAILDDGLCSLAYGSTIARALRLLRSSISKNAYRSSPQEPFRTRRDLQMTPFKMAFTSNHPLQAMSSRFAANAHGRSASVLADRKAHLVAKQTPRLKPVRYCHQLGRTCVFKQPRFRVVNRLRQSG